jgi:hypothetical protein
MSIRDVVSWNWKDKQTVEWKDLHLKVARVNQHPWLWLDGLDGCQLDIIFFIELLSPN